MLTHSEQLRYSRQILLQQVGEQGQQRLLGARVLVVGLGGLGSPVALYLAAAGIGKLLLADDDELDLTNLQRQILYRTDQIGEAKADSAWQQLQQLNPDIELEPLCQRIDQALLDTLVDEIDLVVDCSDNMRTRQLLNRFCVSEAKALVAGAAVGFEGQLWAYHPDHAEAGCYQCLVPDTGHEPPRNCSTAGVIGPLLGVIGSMQALIVLQLLLGLPCAATRQFIRFDAATLGWQTFNRTPQPCCAVCQTNDADKERL